MLAVSLDGNRKLYHIKRGDEDRGLFNGVFVCEDEDVSKFVDYINDKTKLNGVVETKKEQAQHWVKRSNK
ncbi:hypothetical protein QQF64_034218 [Cirrhinus molitorella]|uniref:Uncharacterized protein n=1 Tax=Cirrhinus molitorella TaxID=172907 RepID=A0ABR3MWC6_9TELE